MITLSEYCNLYGLSCHFHNIDTKQYVTLGGGSDLNLLTSCVISVYTVIVRHFYPEASMSLMMFDEVTFDLGTVFDLIKYSEPTGAVLSSPRVIEWHLRQNVE